MKTQTNKWNLGSTVNMQKSIQKKHQYAIMTSVESKKKENRKYLSLNMAIELAFERNLYMQFAIFDSNLE